jgi:hypothetical protein
MGNLFDWIYGDMTEEFKEGAWKMCVSGLERCCAAGRPGLRTQAPPPSRRLCLFVLIRQPEHGAGHEAAEAFVVHEQLEHVGVVLDQGGHDPEQGFVVFDAGVILVRVLLGVAEGRVFGHFFRDVFGDHCAHPVGVLPGQFAEVLVEDLDDVGEPVQFRFLFMPARAAGSVVEQVGAGFDLVGNGQEDQQGREFHGTAGGSGAPRPPRCSPR